MGFVLIAPVASERFSVRCRKEKFTIPSYLIKKEMIRLCTFAFLGTLCANIAASLSSQLLCLVTEDTPMWDSFMKDLCFLDAN